MSAHYRVKQGSSTLGYAVYNRGNVLFTPAPRVAAKVATDVWSSLEKDGEWPEGVTLEGWQPRQRNDPDVATVEQ